jgi:hypothetical protein
VASPAHRGTGRPGCCRCSPHRRGTYRPGAAFTVSGVSIAYTVTCSTDAGETGQTFVGPFSYENGVLELYEVATERENVFTRQL